MAKDEKWQKQATGYKSFLSDRGKTKLSEWYILLYALLQLFGRSEKPEQTENDSEGDMSFSSKLFSDVIDDNISIFSVFSLGDLVDFGNDLF